MGPQLAFGMGDAAALVVSVPPAPPACALIEDHDAPTALAQLSFTGMALVAPPPPDILVLRDDFPRLFNRGSAVGKMLRDGVLLSGVPRVTGPGQHSFRQRRGDGMWRLVTVAFFNDQTKVKSITAWSKYLPQHHEAG